MKQLRRIKPFLFSNDLEIVIHAFISLRLDYCNSLYSISDIQRFQLIQNAAARLLTGSKRYEHITPVLATLHWITLSFRIDFKILF